MKKIAFVTRSMQAGGAERVLQQIITAFCADIECSLFLTEDKPIFYDLPQECYAVVIGNQSGNSAMNKFKQYKFLRKKLKECNPDVVLAMPEEIGIYAILAMIGTGIPVVVSERNNPWVMPYRKVSRILRRVAYRFASGFIFQTGQAASFFSKRIQKRGIVLPNPLDLTRIPERHTGEREKTVAAVGRLDKQKNFPLLIDAFSDFHTDHTEYCLSIYGDGPEGEYLKQYASERLGPGVYTFHGKSTRVLQEICSAGMFVLSSDYEGMPNALIEAMAMGLPCVSTDCPSGGPAALIQNGTNGILVPVGNRQRLTEAMSAMADCSEWAKELGENAVQINKKFDSRVVAVQWRNYLEQCCN